MSAALSWLLAHPPRGLKSQISSTGTTQGVRTVGRNYPIPDSPTWTQAELEIGIADTGPNTSAWRADGITVPVSTAPIPDRASGPRLRFTVAGGCPSSVRGYVGVTNSGGDLANALVPVQAPISALVCRYKDLNGTPQFGLAASRRLTPAQAGQLAGLAYRISIHGPAGSVDEVYHCPIDVGAVTLVAFGYRNRADVDLWVGGSGCATTANGFVTAARFTTGLEPFNTALQADGG